MSANLALKQNHARSSSAYLNPKWAHFSPMSANLAPKQARLAPLGPISIQSELISFPTQLILLKS